MDGINYELTQNLGVWTNEDLINYCTDAEVMMGLEKWQVVKMAQELAFRFDEEIGL